MSRHNYDSDTSKLTYIGQFELHDAVGAGKVNSSVARTPKILTPVSANYLFYRGGRPRQTFDASLSTCDTSEIQ